jgi:hypothetical protein
MSVIRINVVLLFADLRATGFRIFIAYADPDPMQCGMWILDLFGSGTLVRTLQNEVRFTNWKTNLAMNQGSLTSDSLS